MDNISLYRSPVRLVAHAAEAVDPYAAQAIGRARKKMMAEIALTGNALVIDDVPYSRNDAATLLDDVNETSWRTHITIYNYKGLLDFLEKETFDHEALRKADGYLYNQTFVQQVSPYFAYSFNSVSGKLLREEKFTALIQLLSYQGYITTEHSTEAFRKIRTYLDGVIYTVRNLSWEKFIADESIIHFIFSDGWKDFMNCLPSSFASMRDELVEHLINLVLRFQHKATWYYLHQVLVNLKELETNNFNHAELVRIDEIIYRNSQHEGKRTSTSTQKRSSELSSGRVIWWGIWIVLLIVRVATCNNYNNRDNFASYLDNYQNTVTDNSPKEKENETHFLLALDSLNGIKNLHIAPRFLHTGDQPFENIAENSRLSVNDSATINNKSGYDAVFLYFKDVPGHALSGLLPKIYAAYIKNGESQKIYILPGNGRVYFAFGEKWGTLKNPLELKLAPSPNIVTGIDGFQTIAVTEFFSNKQKLQQSLLQNPVYIENVDGERTSAYRYFNKNPSTQRSTTVTLMKSASGFTLQATGRLMVKQSLVTWQ